MPGPAPKPQAMRQRRNKSATRATLTMPAEGSRPVPRMPMRSDGEKWHRLTRAWWRDVWASPMSSEYVEADKHALYRLAALIDQFWYEPNKELAGEIRLEQQAFGLTPLDRRRLEWSIAQTEEATTKRQQRRVRQAQAGDIDPRDVLKVVGE